MTLDREPTIVRSNLRRVNDFVHFKIMRLLFPKNYVFRRSLLTLPEKENNLPRPGLEPESLAYQ